MEQKFKVGDCVRLFWCDSATAALFETDHTVDRVFQGGSVALQDRIGFFHPRQLELIERPKKLVKKKMWFPGLKEIPNPGDIIKYETFAWFEIEVECESD
jgi:hypothetical protein